MFAVISAPCLGARTQSPGIKAAAMRDDDDTCRAMTFQPGTGPSRNCRMSLLQNRETRNAERRAGISQALGQIAASIQATDAYSHMGHSDRLQASCTILYNIITCN